MSLSRSLQLAICFLFVAKWAQHQQQWNGKALVSCSESCLFAQEAFSGVALNWPLDTTSLLMLLRCGSLQWSRLNVHAFCFILKKILCGFNQRIALVFTVHIFICFTVQMGFWSSSSHTFDPGSSTRGCPGTRSHHRISEVSLGMPPWWFTPGFKVCSLSPIFKKCTLNRR